jgi:hypothetical protein
MGLLLLLVLPLVLLRDLLLQRRLRGVLLRPEGLLR